MTKMPWFSCATSIKSEIMRDGSYLTAIFEDQEHLAHIACLGVRTGFGDVLLKIWGLKTLMDGGPFAMC
jgi:hypothetical protein